MKGTLLLLALLVTGELGFHTSEACIPFFGVYLSIVSGNRNWLHTELSPFHPTDEENVAFEKIQDCYEESGVTAKIQDMKLMKAIIFSPECKTYYSNEVKTIIKDKFTKLLGY